MNRRALLTATGVVLSAPLAGCLSEYPTKLGIDRSQSEESEDDKKIKLGGYLLTIHHHPDRSPDEVESSMSSENSNLDDQRLQNLFEEAVRSGRAAYRTHDEAATLQAIVDEIPEDEDDNSQYVTHEGEVLSVRTVTLE
ncbi:hypothetical protein [Natronosalvus vescus]|uniref:hypothetical protein n=1 Tax=Natronosalvus vescus TaxID=2953881 RepID=UPI00209158CF|nr:hypothetical protein [Natronosalvus vescus]